MRVLWSNPPHPALHLPCIGEIKFRTSPKSTWPVPCKRTIDWYAARVRAERHPDGQRPGWAFRRRARPRLQRLVGNQVLSCRTAAWYWAKLLPTRIRLCRW
jgi:hypothetical protein